MKKKTYNQLMSLINLRISSNERERNKAAVSFTLNSDPRDKVEVEKYQAVINAWNEIKKN